jgi:hypothetical protein
VKKLILILALCGSAWGQMAGVSATADISDKTAGTSITDSAVNNTAEAGNLVVCIVASDNIGTAAGDNNDHTSITDSTGSNTWTQAREFTNAGAAAAAATVSVWYSTLAAELTVTTASITANFNGSPTASALSCWEFTKGTGTVTLATGGQEVADDGADPSSLTISGLTSREHLFIRGVASEADSPGFTQTGSYSAFNARGTTGGGGASNMHVGGEFIIATATGHTSDPTVASADHASVFIALWVNDGAAPPTPTPRRRIYVSPGQ